MNNFNQSLTQPNLGTPIPKPYKDPERTCLTIYSLKMPQMLATPRLEDALIGRPPVNIPHNQPDVFDEFNCLNLVISTPEKPYVGAD